MSIFKGTYIQSVDSTGRFVLPADLKNQLGNNCTVLKGTGCLWLVTSTFADTLLDELQSIGGSSLQTMFNPQLAALQRHLFSGMTHLTPELDKNCRIQLSPEQRRYAKITDKIILYGAGTYVEAWNPAELDKFNYGTENTESLFNMATQLFSVLKDKVDE